MGVSEFNRKRECIYHNSCAPTPPRLPQSIPPVAGDSMENPDGGLSFDFEGGLDAAPAASVRALSAGSFAPSDHIDAAVVAGAGATPPDLAGGGPADGYGRRNFRKTVCRHWLRGLCMRGDACGYLHQYDKDRMPVCRFFRLDGGCREKDCLYKHITTDIKECNMYASFSGTSIGTL